MLSERQIAVRSVIRELLTILDGGLYELEKQYHAQAVADKYGSYDGTVPARLQSVLDRFTAADEQGVARPEIDAEDLLVMLDMVVKYHMGPTFQAWGADDWKIFYAEVDAVITYATTGGDEASYKQITTLCNLAQTDAIKLCDLEIQPLIQLYMEHFAAKMTHEAQLNVGSRLAVKFWLERCSEELLVGEIQAISLALQDDSLVAGFNAAQRDIYLCLMARFSEQERKSALEELVQAQRFDSEMRANTVIMDTEERVFSQEIKKIDNAADQLMRRGCYDLGMPLRDHAAGLKHYAVERGMAKAEYYKAKTAHDSAANPEAKARAAVQLRQAYQRRCNVRVATRKAVNRHCDPSSKSMRHLHTLARKSRNNNRKYADYFLTGLCSLVAVGLIVGAINKYKINKFTVFNLNAEGKTRTAGVLESTKSVMSKDQLPASSPGVAAQQLSKTRDAYLRKRKNLPGDSESVISKRERAERVESTAQAIVDARRNLSPLLTGRSKRATSEDASSVVSAASTPIAPAAM